MRLAMVGCGNITEFHVPAMRAAGFDIVAVAGSINSERVEGFARRHQINRWYSDPAALLRDSSEWDALLLTTPVVDTINYIHLAAPIGKPILAEKPVALNHKDLVPILKYENVLVAYNRRFYASIEYAKEFIDTHKNVLLKVSIPEKRLDPEHNHEFPERLPSLCYENSVHIYDLMNYIAGKIRWKAASAILEKDKYLALIALGASENRVIVQLDVCFNSPDNFAINILSEDERIEMRPIEIARYYRGMNVKESSVDTPIRTYVPNMVEQVVVKGGDGLKPGFFGQAKDFYSFCIGNGNGKCASLDDAYNALEVVQSLMNHL